MRRRTRIDLGQNATTKELQSNERKRYRWAARNKDKPNNENPFLRSIKPDNENYGEADETIAELKKRLENLEFGNFPGYFNYRKKATTNNNGKFASNKAYNINKNDSIVDVSNKDDQQFELKKDFIGDSSNNNDNKDDVTKAKAQQKQQHQQGKEDAEALNKSCHHIENESSLESNLNAGLLDERLNCMKKEWFYGKDVLDIGCNRGHITYAIARLFSPKSIVGIDIDLKMIQMANKDLHINLEGKNGLLSVSKELRIEQARELMKESIEEEEAKGVEFNGNGKRDGKYIESLSQFPLSNYISHGPLLLTAGRSKSGIGSGGDGDGDGDTKAEAKISASALSHYASFPNNIIFVEHNYVLARDDLVDRQQSHFDTIICLSVTKWIHLNYKDQGIKRFFKRVYRHLRPAGLFVLEAQPFENYGRRKRLSERLKANFYTIQLKPEQFDAYLLSDQVGFRRIIYETVGQHECAGFKRPVKVFLK